MLSIFKEKSILNKQEKPLLLLALLSVIRINIF